MTINWQKRLLDRKEMRHNFPIARYSCFFATDIFF
jgi:hypothetical protein